MSRKRKPVESSAAPARDDRETEVRIIGGQFRGRRLHYHGDLVVRPMKHRTREAIFNLIGVDCAGRHAIDLFAGTGALALEALSRGAACATLIEKHVPTARIIEENIRTLGIEDRASIAVTSAFLWAKRDLPAIAEVGRTNTIQSDTNPTDKIVPPTTPWLVFCSPPYAFYDERQAEMLDLVSRIQRHSPSESILIVEAEEPFDFEVLRDAGSVAPENANWDVRRYAPAIVGIWRAT